MPARSDPPRAAAFRLRTIAGLLGAVALASVTACSSTTSPTVSLPQVAASTTTSVAATTTQVPSADTARVRQAIVDYWMSSQACGQRPARCRPASFTADAGTLRAVVVAFVATLVRNGYYFAAEIASTSASSDPADAAVNGSFVSIETITVDLTAGTAETAECVYDPTPLLGPAGADGRPTIVSVTSIPRRFQHTVYLEGGTWRVGDERVAPDSTACSFSDNPAPADVTTPPR